MLRWSAGFKRCVSCRSCCSSSMHCCTAHALCLHRRKASDQSQCRSTRHSVIALPYAPQYSTTHAAMRLPSSFAVPVHDMLMVEPPDSFATGGWPHALTVMLTESDVVDAPLLSVTVR